MIFRMLCTLFGITLQNSETYLNSTRFLKSVKPRELYHKEFKNVIVRYQMKFLKIVCYILYFNQMVFKGPFKKWG